MSLKMRQNLTKSQRTQVIDDIVERGDLQAVVYRLNQANPDLPSRKFAEELFTRYHMAHDDYDMFTGQQNIYGRAPSFRTGKSCKAVAESLRTYARDNNHKFKFQVQRAYLTWKHKNKNGPK